MFMDVVDVYLYSLKIRDGKALSKGKTIQDPTDAWNCISTEPIDSKLHIAKPNLKIKHSLGIERWLHT